MSDSITVHFDPAELRNEVEEQGGIKVITSPSPYDIPDAMILDFDKTKKQIVVNFKYLSEEPVRRLAEEGGVTFGLGVNSQRLYEVKVDVSGFVDHAESAATEIVDLIDEKINQLQEQNKTDSRNTDSYAVAEKAVLHGRAELSSRFDNFLSEFTAF